MKWKKKINWEEIEEDCLVREMKEKKTEKN
jgi:hypothetical protein